jgi:hypothetical protein
VGHHLDFDENGHAFKTLKPAGTVYWMQPKPGQELHEDNVNLAFHVEHVFGADFVVGHNIAGGLIFTSGDFVHDVPYDPYMYFLGEEQNISIRAFTRGWTIYNPLHDNIPLCHLYRSAGIAHPTQHWRVEFEQLRVIKFTEFESRAKQRLCELVTGKRDGQPFGLGSVVTIADFTLQSGIDYLSRNIKKVEPLKIKR